jgi:iron-sulfur cluster repair protein YtfE (RIC family)
MTQELRLSENLQYDPALTINEIVAQFPETIAVFNHFGFDTCCGGGIRIDEAATRDGIDVSTVVTAVSEAIARR